MCTFTVGAFLHGAYETLHRLSGLSLSACEILRHGLQVTFLEVFIQARGLLAVVGLRPRGRQLLDNVLSEFLLCRQRYTSR